MTVVVGTAGHIDHGKTALLRALTGIDADRLPEEQRRGMTLDVGYAHLELPNGRLLDFVDVPGHDRLIGNMLVGAGEIDAALLVVAADDGPRPQTREHLALLDALGIDAGLAVITKADLVPPGRVAEARAAVEQLLASTRLAGAPILAASAVTGEGLPEVRAALVALEERLAAQAAGGSRERPPQKASRSARLAIDRVFSIRGRGTVITGTLRGTGIEPGDAVRIEPGGLTARVREVQVHGSTVPRATAGRTALNLSGVDATALRRGQVVVLGAGLDTSDRLLVAIRAPAAIEERASEAWPPADGTRVRLHLGTEQVGARIGRRGREAAELDGAWAVLLRLEAPVAVAVGDRFVLRRPSPGAVVAGGFVLDPMPPAGVARRRIDRGRLAALFAAVARSDRVAILDALTNTHGALGRERLAAVTAMVPGPDGTTPGREAALAPDVAEDLAAVAVSAVKERPAGEAIDPGVPLSELRAALAARARRLTGASGQLASAAAAQVVEGLVAEGRLARAGDRVRDPARTPGLPATLLAAMDRLEALLAVPAPPPLGEAARGAGCPPEGIRALEAAGRIVRLEPDLAWASETYRRLAAQALAMARERPLSPAAFRDATGTSRRYVVAILEDLDRQGILRRGPEGHQPGPRAAVAGLGMPVDQAPPASPRAPTASPR